MGTTAERMTVEDYYAITVEGDRRELVDGRIVVDEPLIPHWRLQTRILAALLAWAAEPGRGWAGTPLDVRLDDHNLYAPDVVWFAQEHLPPPGALRIEGTPDICVEIRSPSTWRYVVRAKRDGYERGGCPELWLVDDRARSVLVYRRSRPDSPSFDVEHELGDGDTLESPQLPGFALPLGELFRDL